MAPSTLIQMASNANAPYPTVASNDMLVLTGSNDQSLFLGAGGLNYVKVASNVVYTPSNLTVAGSVTATTFVGALTGNASTATSASTAWNATIATSAMVATHAETATTATSATTLSGNPTIAGILTTTTLSNIGTFSNGAAFSNFGTFCNVGNAFFGSDLTVRGTTIVQNITVSNVEILVQSFSNQGTMSNIGAAVFGSTVSTQGLSNVGYLSNIGGFCNIGNIQVEGNAVFYGNISAGNMGMFRNRIINGDMRVNQRDVTSTNYTGAIAQYVYDRYNIENLNVNSDSIVNISQNTLTSSDTPYQFGFNKSLKITINGVDSSASTRWFGGLCQNIEGYNISDFSLGTTYSSSFTVSTWFRSSMSNGSTVTIAARTSSSEGTNYTYLTNVIVAGSNNWQYLQMTVPPLVSGTIATTSNNALQLFIAPSVVHGGFTNPPNSWIENATYVSTTTTNWANTVGNWVEFTGVQLEKGTIATPFEFRPYPIELQLCQRYYYRITNTSGSLALGMATVINTSSVRSVISLPVPLRTNPSLSYSSSNDFQFWNFMAFGGAAGFNSNLLISDQYNLSTYSIGIQMNFSSNNFTQNLSGIFYLVNEGNIAFNAEL